MDGGGGQKARRGISKRLPFSCSVKIKLTFHANKEKKPSGERWGSGVTGEN